MGAAFAYCTTCTFILHSFPILRQTFSSNKSASLSDGLLGVVAVGFDAQRRAFGGREDDHLHDAFPSASRLVAAFKDCDIAT